MRCHNGWFGQEFDQVLLAKGRDQGFKVAAVDEDAIGSAQGRFRRRQRAINGAAGDVDQATGRRVEERVARKGSPIDSEVSQLGSEKLP